MDGSCLPSWFYRPGRVAEKLELTCPRFQFDVLEPILDELLEIRPQDSENISSIRKLLEAIPLTSLFETSEAMADRDSITTKYDNERETIVCFTIRGHRVRLMQAKDLDVTSVKTYSRSTRAKDSASKTRQVVNEERMPVVTQQYLMAQILRDRPNEFSEKIQKANAKRLSSGPPKGPRTAEKSVFSDLRTMAREKYWMAWTEMTDHIFDRSRK